MQFLVEDRNAHSVHALPAELLRPAGADQPGAGELPLPEWVALVRATVPPPALWRRRPRPGFWRRLWARMRRQQ